MPGAPPESGRAGPHQLAYVPLSPDREQGSWEAAGGIHSPGRQAPLWGWGWAKARLRPQPTGRGPGRDQHGHGYKTARDVTPKRRRLALMEVPRSAVWEPPFPSDIRVMRCSPQLHCCKVGSEPQQPNLQKGK